MTEAELERLAKLIEDRVAGVEAYVEQSRAMGLNADKTPRQQGVIEGYRGAARLIREQPAEPAWIAAATRLPAPHTVVYVFHNGHQSIGTYDHVNRTFRDDNDDLLPGATHWAALMDGPPCNRDHTPNAETIEAMRAADRGDVTHYASAEGMFEAMGIDESPTGEPS